ncbi:MAG: YggT family protein [Clostridiales Family XIII bacterium]|jgi:YggT family protein|nr:YggT family protein [Clostridiales Family XIII bacterium]
MIFIILANIINVVCNILIIVMLARSVLSWIVYSGNQYNTQLGRLFQILTALTEPIVAPVRRLISRFMNTGSVDFAPLAAFFIIIIASRILTRILYALA